MKVYSIKEFLDIKEKCAFCNEPLKPNLSCYSSHLNTWKNTPTIISKFNNNNCNFDINYDSISVHIKANVSVNLDSDELSFNVDPDSYYHNNYVFCNSSIIDVLSHLKPYIILECNNRKCKMNYYICSNSFYIYSCLDDKCFIKPFRLYYDACTIDKYWVQNDWIYNKTNILRLQKPDSDGIKIPLIDLVNSKKIDKDKFCSRIRTIVTFS